MFGEHLALKVSASIFTVSMESKKYFEILKNHKSGIDILFLYGILLLRDNDEIHNSECLLIIILKRKYSC